jgi:predicted amidohydrolase YtcJ
MNDAKRCILVCIKLIGLISAVCWSLFLLPVDPTGLFKDMASRLITHHIPPMSVEERREALIRASELALSRGVTSVVDFGRVGASEHPWSCIFPLSSVFLVSLDI